MSYQEDNFTEIANAIRAQIGGGSIQATQFASKIGLINSDDAYTVRFIDYDGTVLKEQIVAPGESVTPPVVSDKAATNLRPALTFQGWNHPQSEFDNVQCDIDAGAIYVPSDGKTHVYLRLNAATGFAIPIYIYKEDASQMTVDWGDGTTSTSSASGNVSFTSNYATIGLKHISIQGVNYQLGHSNSLVGNTNQAYRETHVACYVGAGCIIPYAGFYNNYALNVVTLPNNVSINTGENFENCKSLRHINIPQSVNILRSYLFLNASSLISISLPYGLTTIGDSSFANCSSLKHIAIPPTTTVIGTTALNSCSALEDLTIPASVSQISQAAFANCTAIKKIRVFPQSYLYLGSTVFSAIFSCSNWDIKHIIPDYFQSGDMFYSSFNMDDTVQVPNGTTSVASGTFFANKRRTFFNIPSSVASIGAGAFQNCNGLKYIIFNSITPPTLADVNALSGHPTSCIYFVPDASLAAYQTATNWATYANQIRPYSEFNINDFQ